MTKLSVRHLGLIGCVIAAIAYTATPARASFWNWNVEAPNLIGLLEKDGRFKTLLVALDAADLTETVATAEALTLLAPTDDAFAKIPPDKLQSLLKDKELLTRILLYHVLGGKQGAGSLLYRSTATTLEGNPVLFLIEGKTVRVNGNRLIGLNWRASNGLVHVLDGVLLPPSSPITINSVVDILTLDGRFKILLAALDAAGLKETVASLPELTLFAPTDEAFAALPPGAVEDLLADKDALSNVLLYHVLGKKQGALSLITAGTAETLQGDSVTVRIRDYKVRINNATVINPNVRGPNGIIHVIDSVLLPPVTSADLLSLLRNDGRFNTLVAALELTGLAETVATGGPFTIFAPTDAAFAALPEGVLEGLLANKDQLTNILLYHVVSGTKTASDLLSARRVTTLQRSDVVVWKWWTTVFVNRARVIDANLTAENGIVHGINQVLLPPTN